MVRINIDENGYVMDSTALGGSFEIAAQICGAIRNIYYALTHADEDIAEEFRFAVTSLTAKNGEAWNTAMMAKTGSGLCCLIVPPDFKEESEE